MNLVFDEIDGITFAAIFESSLDASNNHAFVDAVTPVLKNGGEVVFDMSRVRFVDSSALGSMMVCMRRVKNAGGMIRLCGLSKPVFAMFELVRMDRIFDIYATKDEVLRALQR